MPLTLTDFEEEDGFVLVTEDYTLSPYTRYELNTIIFGGIHESSSDWKVKNVINPSKKSSEVLGWIFQQDGNPETIALFKTANVPLFQESSYKCDDYASLDMILHTFQHNQLSCQKLVIPLADIKKSHFRLLVIYPNEKLAKLYDSKSMWIGNVSELILSGMAACLKSKNDKLFFITIWKAFIESYHTIMRHCEKFFPDIQFEEAYFGHQEAMNHIDCGPYTAEYALTEILSEPVSHELKISIPDVRIKHQALFDKYKECTQLEPSYSVLDYSIESETKQVTNVVMNTRMYRFLSPQKYILEDEKEDNEAMKVVTPVKT